MEIMETPDVKPITEALATARSLLVVTPPAAGMDQLAAALGLYLTLKEAGKAVVVANPKPAVTEYARLVGIDELTQKLGNRNLVVSFNYVQEAIEKVSYNVDGGKFNLVIQPKEGAAPLDPASVSYSYEGTDAQVVFVIGAKTLAELGDMYLTEKRVFEQAVVVNVDNQLANAKFGQVNWVDVASPSVSEIMVKLIQSLGLKLSSDGAGNLWQGLQAATNNFQGPKVGAGTFEAAAAVLRAGARKDNLAHLPSSQEATEFNQVLKQLQPQSEPAGAATEWLKPPKVYKGSMSV